ncbi:MAG: helix-turn-helix domain-containing protein [Coriobacteriales bacterium]|jgi:excisionase family DNA binding protein|nr:helix-turn-helix domain-containing protein [Coriobacteriales bacterium]
MYAVAQDAECHGFLAHAHKQEITRNLFGNLPDIMDSGQAAKALGVPEQSLRNLARRRELQGLKIGSRWKFTRLSLIDYVEKQELALTGRSFYER